MGEVAREREVSLAPLIPPPHLAGGYGGGALEQGSSDGPLAASPAVAEAVAAIAQHDERLGAFISVLDERARERAAEVDALGGPLAGSTLAVKDCIEVAGVANTCGSAARREALAQTTAPAVAALEAAGAVVVGTTNLHEWAFGATSQNEAYGAVDNPWRSGHIPGGSSGGSAVAVAAGMASLALGTDTGGSIRLPASYCGTVGLKVTTGSVSTEGCFPLSWTMDSIGPLAGSVGDLAVPLEALLATGSRSFAPRPLPRLGELRVGLWPGIRDSVAIDPDVHELFLAALDRLEESAGSVSEIALPDLDEIATAQMQIVTSEAAVVHSQEQVDRSSYEDNVRELIELGDRVPATAYVEAQRHRQRVWAALERVFERVDVVVSPTTPCLAPPVGEAEIEWPDGSSQPVMEASIRYLLIWNFIGAPALSVPCGLARGLPVGLQIAAPPGADRALVACAVALEELLRPAETASPPGF